MKHLLLFIGLFGSAFSSIAQIDSSFGVYGHVTFGLSPSQQNTNVCRSTFDNAFIVGGSAAGTPNTVAYLKKFSADGLPDSSFAGGLFQFSNIPLSTNDVIYDICQLADSSYLLFCNSQYSYTNTKQMVLKISQNGVWDNTYHGTGKVFFQVPGGPVTYSRTALLRSDGSYLMAGTYATSTFANKTYITKYFANGDIDPSFGTAGCLTLNIPDSSMLPLKLFEPTPNHFLYLLNGSISAAQDYYFIKFDSAGHYDASFGIGGIKKLTGFQNFSITDVKRSGNAYYFCGGMPDLSSNVNGGIIKTDTDGTIDVTFGTGGLDSTLHLGSHSFISGMEIMYGNTFFLSGTKDSAPDVFFLEKKHFDGTLDSAFGIDGVTLTRTGSSVNDFANRSTILSDDSWIVMGNYTSTSGDNPVTMCKVKPDYAALENNKIEFLNCNVYPNPAKEKIVIEGNFDNRRLDVRFSDITGKTIFRETVENQGKIELLLPVLCPGTYLLNISDGRNLFNRLVIVD